MRRKLISWILGVMMIISGGAFAFAEEDVTESPQVQEIQAVSTVTGQPSDLTESKDSEEQKEQGTGSTSEEGTKNEEQPDDNAASKETGTDEEESPVLNLFFTDVQDTTAYYYHPVYWAVKNGITQGTSDTQFSPDFPCTRAQIVTFLWRKAGTPEPTAASNPFTDISKSDYYFKAVLWAVESGITSGTTDSTFSPDDVCTRAQCVTFLWRAMASPVPQISGAFEDVSSDAYYAKAVGWALENGVTSGTSATQFSPEAWCTRAQTMTFFYRASLERVDRKDGSVSGSFTGTAVNQSTGLVQLRAEDVASDSGVQSVRAAVWTKDNQTDLHWYEMQDLNDGILEAKWSVQDFHHTFGIYHAKLYIVTGSDQMIEADQKDYEVQAHGYLYAERWGNDGDLEIHVTAMGIPEGSAVRFASWSDENYLDDLFWADAEYQGDGTWSAVFSTTEFAHGGVCNTDVYVNGNEVWGTTSYSLELWETMTPIEWEIYGYTQDVYQQVGTDLHSLFMWCVGLTYYRATPEPASGYTNSEWYALYGFKNHRGHCYVYAATFYWLAKNLGYDIHYVQGYVPRKGGGVITHGWTELIQNGTLYVVDPNFTNETGRNGYKITYGTSGTWRYQNYKRMS